MLRKKRQDNGYSSVIRQSLFTVITKDFKKNKIKYLMILPVVIYIAIFCYKPMYGVVIAFKNYRPALGIAASKWVGLDHFTRFFNDYYFWRILRNTISISGLSILFGFPAPIILALLINEIKNKHFKKTVQTISYMPYFISIVIISGLIKTFTQSDGLITDLVVSLGGAQKNLLASKVWFYPIYIISGIWQSVGWDSIIYLAAITGIDQEQYEAAKVDGAGRIRQMLYITLPGLLPTITILFILRMGGILNVGFEKILLLYSSTTYEVADVISTYVYRIGVLDANFSYSTAIGLFNALVNILFLIITNAISKKVNKTGLF
ncbi:putative multiple-sugar transport system permease YteP [Anaerocolumna cellulosilytica]|uniref:Putative multiple-sugar transport system permease YteP n=1 Tax=Anaerocolumna cellulosilytica TaxID=433286 RepID=A0A6S6QWW6_9FIRM|nr:ABC transporter permease subunit [Anaerocolumna cellulosilytica]MBB5194820.1 putative aldouronate transport system permease protein [Anaerocolumna cellulosilytica]BCJ94216.1 putative multiple-sugar transport system permease YteP [Anaerocolumna cellulosilytica]